jgi:hypothetical protein
MNLGSQGCYGPDAGSTESGPDATSGDSGPDADAGLACVPPVCANGSCACDVDAGPDAGTAVPTVLATSTLVPGPIAVDGTNVYFGTSAGVYEVPLDGGTSTQLTVPGSPSANPFAIAVDGSNVYWTTSDATLLHAEVWAVSIAGGPPSQTRLAAFGGANAPLHTDPVALAINATNIYWTNQGTTDVLTGIPIAGVPDGGSVAVLATGTAGGGLALLGNSAYFGDNGFIKSVPLGGGAPRVVVSDACGANALLAVAGANVYFAYPGGPGIMSVPVAGGPTMLVTPAPTGVNAFAVDATRAYWLDATGSVYSAPLVGGCPTALVSRSGSGYFLAVDGTSLYWTDPRSNQVLKVAK